MRMVMLYFKYYYKVVDFVFGTKVALLNFPIRKSVSTLFLGKQLAAAFAMMTGIVEAVVFFASAAYYTLQTIENEFVYQVVSESNNFTSNRSVEYCNGNRTTKSDEDQIVADEASRWIMYSKVVSYGTNSISALIITSLSEKIGRKRALLFPVFGCFLSTAVQAFIILFRLPLYFVVLNGLSYGIFGGYPALLDISTAYLSDTVKKKDRGKRYTILEVCSSLGGGLTLLGTGYWIKYQGFVPSSFLIVGCSIVALILLGFLSESNPSHKENVQQPADNTEIRNRTCQVENQKERSSFHHKSKRNKFLIQIKEVVRIYTSNKTRCNVCEDMTRCSHGGERGKGRVWRLWFYVMAWASYMFVLNGIDVFQTMFFVSYPICFTPELVGIQNGIDASAILLSPILVKLYESCLHMNSQTILLTGIIGRLLTSILMYLARGPTLVFLATSISLFSGITTPFIRVRMSYLVSSSEQGPSLALLACVSSLVSIFSPIAFLSIYPATLHISYSFTWLVTATIFLLPLSLMTSIWIVNKRGNNSDTENKLRHEYDVKDENEQKPADS